MSFNFFVGIDISKNTLDFVVRGQENVHFHQQTENSKKGIKAFEKQCKKNQVDLSSALICMEHTGIYNACSLDYFHSKGYALWLENAIQIKQSLGMVRGKSDKVDAERICEYACRYQDKCRLWEPDREVIIQIRHLSTLRRRLIDAKNQLKTPMKETKKFLPKDLQEKVEKLNEKPLKVLKESITVVDGEIRELIRCDNRLKELFEQVSSVTGVGEVLFCEFIITSNEFKRITDPKKFACYSGVAPFEHSSGTSVRGKNRVSKMANKSTKRLLHMSAMSAITSKGELQTFYKRKVAEGKNKMSALNAVRNKIIHRVFACVRDGRKYDKTYTHSLA
jgi:transposase